MVMYLGRWWRSARPMTLYATPGIPTRALAVVDAVDGPGRPHRGGAARRRSAEPDRAAHGLPLSSALPACGARVQPGVPERLADRQTHVVACLDARAGQRAPSAAGAPFKGRPHERSRPAATLVEVGCDLSVDVHRRRKPVHAVNGVSLQVRRGEVVALIGESGSGKSVTLRTLLRLHRCRNAPASGGQVAWRARTCSRCSRARAESAYRGKVTASMIFQEPLLAIRPGVQRSGAQIVEAIRATSRPASAEAHAAGAAAVRARAHSQPRAAPAGLSARAVRRHAAARHDRAGPGLQAQGAAGRRADHRAGRHGADPDPAAAARAAARAGHVGDLRHARHRRGRRDRRSRRRDVRRPHRRAGHGRATCCARRAILTRWRCCAAAPTARSRRARGWRPSPARRPTWRRCPRLCLCRALRAGRERLPPGATQASQVVELAPNHRYAAHTDAAAATCVPA
jgi:ABC-type oligopeptide transport system ATPase subunit